MMYESTNAETIDKILEIGQPVTHTRNTAGGAPLTFSTKHFHRVDDADPLPEALSVTTLQAIVDLLSQDVSLRITKDKVLVHVISPTAVEVTTRELDQWSRRPRLILSSMKELERKFPFGSWLKQEDFIIGLQSCFAPSVDATELLKLASSLASEDRLQVEDSGIAQTVTAKQGISLQQTVPIKPRQRLTPYRTFKEADQVESTFILRIKKGNDGFPLLALFEADGGAWRSIAQHNVAEWLRAELPEGYLVVE